MSRSNHLNRYPVSIFPTPLCGTFTNSFCVHGRYSGLSCFCWHGSFRCASSTRHLPRGNPPSRVFSVSTVFQSGPSGRRIAHVTWFHSFLDSKGPCRGTSSTFFGSTGSFVTSRKSSSYNAGIPAVLRSPPRGRRDRTRSPNARGGGG